ncbi:hypothetical protein JHK85_042661 [Glycine max]|nr:hypothetical protein JHK85_042661 [Glycine max]
MASMARGAKRRHAVISKKMLILFSASLSCVVLLVIFSLFRFHSPKPPISISISRVVFDGPPKIAFLFLVRRNLPLDFLWDAFFQNGDVSRFSIYVHSAPGFVLDESTTRSQLFYGRQISNSIQVLWGESSMIQAERLLLAAALEDHANQRFVLLSDSFLDAKEGRYNPKMSTKIPREKWRKGSQRRPPIDTSKGKLNLKLQKQHNCIPDEHYVQTLLAMHDLEGELERRTLTYTLWNQSTTKMENKGWHPITFGYSNASPQRIKEIKGINHVYYETEYRIEWCHTNSTSVPCFLFARKFSQGAAMRLLSQEVVNHFEVSALLATPT